MLTMVDPAPSSRLSVVVHVDDADPDRQRLALGNVANLLRDVGEAELNVEVVFNGPAVWGLRHAGELSELFDELTPAPVQLIACANSLAGAGIDPEELRPGVQIVPAGITHLVRRQHDGWAYVRP
jgi:intracellular sulfur oxidation DsrE/DsrF family protein